MSGKEDGWTEVGRSGARPDLELYEPQQPSEELEKNPFSQQGETDDPSTDLAAAREEAAGNRKERSQPLEDGRGFGAAGIDADVKAPLAEEDDSLPEEYGAADDEFVTRTNYPPSEPEQKS